MSKRLLFALTGLACFAVSASEAELVGDPEAGLAKSAACVACHGMDGNSPADEWPKLAGQHADYTRRHTALVRDGGRDNPTMLPFVQSLSDQDIADIAAYFATKASRPGVADDSAIEGREQSYADLGAQLYRGGKVAAGVPACTACHGPSGRGLPGAGFPALGGQFAAYTADRLRLFQAGQHYGESDDPSTIMVTIAQRLDETEINALATYIEGLHRADTGSAPAATAASAPAAPAPAVAPEAASTPAADAEANADPGT